MKDLFVELTRLHTALATAGETALDLRTAMLTASPREADLELHLYQQLLHLSADAQKLATALREKQIGINFTDPELRQPTAAPTRHRARKTRKARKA